MAAAHGNLTPAHADGCAAQCFEGVQRGSIIIPNSESWPPCCHARLQTGLLARLSSYLDGSWRAVCRLVRFGTLSVCLCSAKRVVKVHTYNRLFYISAEKGAYLPIGTFLHRYMSAGGKQGSTRLPPHEVYLRRYADSISRNCIFVGGFLNGLPAI